MTAYNGSANVCPMARTYRAVPGYIRNPDTDWAAGFVTRIKRGLVDLSKPAIRKSGGLDWDTVSGPQGRRLAKRLAHRAMRRQPIELD